MARRVEEIRGIEFDEVPEPQVTDTEELRDLAEKQIAKPKAAETIAASDAELKLLGLLEPDESLADVTTDVSADAAAYYDPKEKELFLLGDAVPAGPALTEFVLAHELNHALEDQAFGLPKSSPSSDDAVLAESALVEGSATALMTEYAVEHLAVTDLLDETGALESGATDLPDIAMAQVTFAYFGGQRFVDELRANADGGWDLVDFAYQRRLPATTEQILHPEKYLEDEGALPVPDIPDPGPGWEEVDDGTVGEFFTREILRQDAEEVGADEAAAGLGRRPVPVLPAQGRAFRVHGRLPRGQCARDRLARRRRGRGGWASHCARRVRGTLPGRRRCRAAAAWELEGGGWAAMGGSGEVVSLALAPDEATARAWRFPVDPTE